MAQSRVVAELGRPETPSETAERKAASSRTYRQSQNVRNLFAAIIITVAVVAVVIFAVPRGTPPEREPIDVATIAAEASAAQGADLVVAEVPENWTVNSALVTTGDVRAWTVVYVPADTSYLRIAQGLGADENWPARELGRTASTESIMIDGIEWDVYRPSDSRAAGNVTYGLATTAGADIVMVYGTADAETAAEAAASLSEQIRDLREQK